MVRVGTKIESFAFQLRLQALRQTGTEPAWLRMPHRFACHSPAPLSPHFWTRPEVLELLHLGQDPLPTEGTPLCSQLWTGPARAGGHRLMASTRPDPEVTKPDPLTTLAAPRNSVHNSYEQNWWQREVLAESNPLREWVRLTAGNADQALTPAIEGVHSPHKGARHPIIPENSPQDFLTLPGRLGSGIPLYP